MHHHPRSSNTHAFWLVAGEFCIYAIVGIYMFMTMVEVKQ